MCACTANINQSLPSAARTKAKSAPIQPTRDPITRLLFSSI
jgi:hypothetical protein